MWDVGWQVISTLVIVAGCIAVLLFSRLQTLLPTYSATEVATAKSSQHLKDIAENPINAPFKVVDFAYSYVTKNPLLATRLTAATFGTATLVLFYIGMRNWYRRRIAFLATVLFACSSWFLHVARFGSPDILLPCSILLLTVCGYWIATARHSHYSYILAVIALGICIYVPGLVWLLILAAVVRRKDIVLLSMRLTTWQKVLLFFLIAMLVIAPLVYSIVRNPHVGLMLLGLPSSLPDPLNVLKNLALLPASIFIWSHNQNPELGLGHLPLLDIFGSIMFILGLYYYFTHRTLDRAKLLAVFFVLSFILIAIGGPVHTAVLLPAVYVVVTGGMALLLGQWLDVFPENPVAKSMGIALITAAVLTSCLFNLRYYFIAWPHNDATQSTYTHTHI